MQFFRTMFGLKRRDLSSNFEISNNIGHTVAILISWRIHMATIVMQSPSALSSTSNIELCMIGSEDGETNDLLGTISCDRGIGLNNS